jgi:hypothetical protein
LFLPSGDRFLRFHFFGVFAEAGFAVARGAVMERLLGLIHVRCIAFPSFKHRSL